jgi:hypothetical protein
MWRNWSGALAIAGLGLVVAACGSSAGSISSTTLTANNLVGKRYCEVLLIHSGPTGLYGVVYNTYPLNACPESEWAELDAGAIAKQDGALYAELNGPRYWLMNSIDKVRTGAEVVKTFGRMAMIEEATVAIGSNITAALVPFTPHTVSRQASFTFDAGREVYELVDPNGTRWVMQTWSQIKDPTLSLADLPSLAPRLTLPSGWAYRVRTLSKPLIIATANHPAQVLQDNLEDSYSREKGA